MKVVRLANSMMMEMCIGRCRMCAMSPVLRSYDFSAWNASARG